MENLNAPAGLMLRLIIVVINNCDKPNELPNLTQPPWTDLSSIHNDTQNHQSQEDDTQDIDVDEGDGVANNAIAGGRQGDGLIESSVS